MWLPLSTTPRHVLAPTVIGYDSSPFTSQSLGLPFFPNTYIPHMAHTLRPIIKLWNVSAPAHFRNLDTPHVRMIRICHGSLIHVACGAGPFEYQDLSSECCRLCPILICVRDGGTHNGMMHSLSSFVTVRTPFKPTVSPHATSCVRCGGGGPPPFRNDRYTFCQWFRS